MRIVVDEPSLNTMRAAILRRCLAARPAVNEAMANAFYDVVMNNFGPFGLDRPDWEKSTLSPAYAKKVGRPIATLVLTGALKSAVQKGGSEGESVTVSVSNSSVPYATVHQLGSARMPARPYFPIERNGDVRPYTLDKVVEAAQQALWRALS